MCNCHNSYWTLLIHTFIGLRRLHFYSNDNGRYYAYSCRKLSGWKVETPNLPGPVVEGKSTMYWVNKNKKRLSAKIHSVIYTVSQIEKRPTILFFYNFAKCWSISKILSPLDSVKNLNKIIAIFQPHLNDVVRSMLW